MPQSLATHLRQVLRRRHLPCEAGRESTDRPGAPGSAGAPLAARLPATCSASSRRDARQAQRLGARNSELSSVREVPFLHPGMVGHSFEEAFQERAVVEHLRPHAIRKGAIL